jgi:hypothetical protein
MARNEMSEPVFYDLRRLFWVGPLTVAVAIAAVLAVRVVAGAILTLPPDFLAVTWPFLTTFTAFFVTLAVLVFAVVAVRATDPARSYRRIAFGALIVSLIPDLLLPPLDPVATWPAVVVLMITHVAAWWPTVRILTTLGLRPLR